MPGVEVPPPLFCGRFSSCPPVASTDDDVSLLPTLGLLLLREAENPIALPVKCSNGLLLLAPVWPEDDAGDDMPSVAAAVDLRNGLVGFFVPTGSGFCDAKEGVNGVCHAYVREDWRRRRR